MTFLREYAKYINGTLYTCDISSKNINNSMKFTENFIKSLPFKLTNSQILVWKEILKDLESSNQMVRLLQGDVGSGKTIVALLAVLQAFNSSFQAAIMVPTSLLAQQHFLNIQNLFSKYHNPPQKIIYRHNLYIYLSCMCFLLYVFSLVCVFSCMCFLLYVFSLVCEKTYKRKLDDHDKF